MREKKLIILSLLAELDEPFLTFFDTDSNEMLDLKIEVLSDLKKGKRICDIPKFYDILELYPRDEDGKEILWDL